MSKNLYKHYESELTHLRHLSAEFREAYPKIAGRLGLSEKDCKDPFVERLLQGFAYLTARVRLKMDAEYPTFTQSLLETVYPDYLAPMPSMTIVEMTPSPEADGVQTVARETELRNVDDRRTKCEFRTSQDVDLWPIEIVNESEYAPHYYLRDLGRLGLPDRLGARAALRIRLRMLSSEGDIQKNLEGLDELTFYIDENESLGGLICEQVFARASHVIVRSADDYKCKNASIQPVSLKSPQNPIVPVGFEPDEAILPVSPRGFEGYRLLREFFGLPKRFQFFKITGLAEAVSRCKQRELDIIIAFAKPEKQLENRIKANSFRLFSTPAVNLFKKRTDHILVSNRTPEYQVITDRTRPLDFEVYGIERVIGYGETTGQQQEFQSFYRHSDKLQKMPGFYTVRRERRELTSRERRYDPVSSYIGTNCFISLVDSNAAPFSPDIRELGVRALCTNRHLPILMPTGNFDTDFFIESDAQPQSVRCLFHPTDPVPSFVEGEYTWRLISHLALNYLSLEDTLQGGATGLREILRLYDKEGESGSHYWLEGILSMKSKPILRRSPHPGPVAFARGLEVILSLDEQAFVGHSTFNFGRVISEFLTKYVSINSFVETAVSTNLRGEVARWPAKAGRRPIL